MCSESINSDGQEKFTFLIISRQLKSGCDPHSTRLSGFYFFNWTLYVTHVMLTAMEDFYFHFLLEKVMVQNV